MLNISIVKTTSISCTFTIATPITFTTARLIVGMDGEGDVTLDEVSIDGNLSAYEVMSIDSGTGEFYVDLNSVPFGSIYYKTFRIDFLDELGNIIDSTVSFGMTPSGVDYFYGVINKLKADFEVLAKVSGVNLRVFLPNTTAEKCPACWDAELGQATSSNCQVCGGADKYRPVDILAKKNKTSSKQTYNKKGVAEHKSIMFSTYSRIGFGKGVKIANLATKEIYDITDSSIATISGIRTSTTVVVSHIDPNDSRALDILDLLK